MTARASRSGRTRMRHLELRRRWLALLLAAAVGLGMPVLGSPPTVTDLGDHARRVLENDRYQKDLSAEDAEVERERRERTFGVRLPGSAAAGSAASVVSRALFWTLIAALAVVLLLALGSTLIRALPRRRSDGPMELLEAEGPESGSSRVEDAERLARQGRYAEAVHLLLLAAVESLIRGSRIAVDQSRTSREILRVARLEEDGRGALRRLVEAVERSLFGGQALGPEEYAGCRRALEVLEGIESAEAGGGAVP